MKNMTNKQAMRNNFSPFDGYFMDLSVKCK